MKKTLALLITLFIYLISYSQIVDMTEDNEDSVHHFMPYLLDSMGGISGLNVVKPIQRNDTLRYWLIVVDTINKGGNLPRFPTGIKFRNIYAIRGYGLWVVSAPGKGYWKIFDPIWRPIEKDSLVIFRIFQEAVLPYKSPVPIKSPIPINKREITVNNKGIKIRIIKNPK